MIESEQHYQIAKSEADKFVQALAEWDRYPVDPTVHPMLLKAERDGLYYRMLELREDIASYEVLRRSAEHANRTTLNQAPFGIEPGNRDSGQRNGAYESRTLLIAVTGPTGAGKDTVVRQLLACTPHLRCIPTWTTRDPRPSDADGLPYHFVTTEAFEQMKRQRGFLEVNQFGTKKSYGSPRAPVRQALAEGDDVILRVDPNGAAALKRRGAVTIFITPPSIEVLYRFLEGRDPPDEVAKRLAIAETEMPRSAESEYVIVNHEGADGIRESVLSVQAILRAERLRVGRKPPRI